jgi:hypothetical protein
MDEDIKDKFDRLDDVPREFTEGVERTQRQIMDRMEKLLSQMETKDGQFVFSDKNLAALESIDNELKNIFFSPAYEKDLKNFASEFNKQAAINDTYFSGIVNDYEVKPIYQSTVRVAQRNTIELLTGDNFTQPLMTPLKELLNTAITNEGSYYETLQGLRKLIVGNDEIPGKLLSHAKRVTYDGFAISDRNYTTIVSKDLGLEFYRMSGSTVKDSRCFCLERINKYFHRKEIEDWGDGKNVGKCGHPWQGMNSLTNKDNIFALAGGYNCKHSFLPVAERSVPKSVIDRNKENVNVK